MIYSTDQDQDGLSLADEFLHGTSDLNPDTDGDLVIDYYEVEFYNTDPLKADTDGDGYDDGTELLNGFDPLG